MFIKSTSITYAKNVTVAIFFAYAILSGSASDFACAIILFVIIDFAYAILSGSARDFAHGISLNILHIYTCYQEYNRHMQFFQAPPAILHVQFLEALRAFCMCNIAKYIAYAIFVFFVDFAYATKSTRNFCSLTPINMMKYIGVK